MRSVLSVVLMLAITLPISVQAQIQDPEPLRYGVLAGWSRTDWDYDSEFMSGDFFEAKNGFQAGFFMDGRMSGPLGLRVELLYARLGAKTVVQGVDENGDPFGEVTQFFNADYLQIPVLFTVDLVSGPVAVRPSIFLGPRIGLNVSARWKLKGNSPNPYLTEVEGDLDMDDADAGLVFGGGVEWDAGGHPLLVQIRYDLGLTDARASIKNQGMTLMAGYGF